MFFIQSLSFKVLYQYEIYLSEEWDAAIHWLALFMHLFKRTDKEKYFSSSALLLQGVNTDMKIHLLWMADDKEDWHGDCSYLLKSYIHVFSLRFSSFKKDEI